MRLDPDLRSYGRQVRKDPQNDDLHIKIATIFLSRFRSLRSPYHWIQAVRHFEHGHRLRASSGQCYLVVGTELERQGDDSKAAEIYGQGMHRFLQLQKDDSLQEKDSLENLALVYRFLLHKATRDPQSRILLRQIPDDILKRLLARKPMSMDPLFFHQNGNILVEGRYHPRIQINSETDLVTGSTKGIDEIQTSNYVLSIDLLDLSEDGAKIRLGADLDVGTSVKLTLLLGGTPIVVNGTTRWTRQTSRGKGTIVGIEIQQVSKKDRLYISDHIRSFLSDPT